jgi:uncharacterized radical SAM superfamily Fe-S cluster-containing enzyme
MQASNKYGTNNAWSKSCAKRATFDHAHDVRSIKKSCVHIVSLEDKKIIPFETMNLFYRDPMKRAYLEKLRAEEVPMF